jgi:hypothetical protein
MSRSFDGAKHTADIGIGLVKPEQATQTQSKPEGREFNAFEVFPPAYQQ